MTTLADVLTAVRDALALDATLAALDRPENPPDKLNLPAMIVYGTNGAIAPATHDGRWHGGHTVTIEIHVPRTDLARAYARLMTYQPLVSRRLIAGFAANRFAETLVRLGSNSAAAAGEPLRYRIENDDWAAVATLALIYELDVTIEEVTT